MQSVGYHDEHGRPLKKFVATYDEAVAFIDKNAVTVSRKRPEFVASDRYQEGESPEVATDSVGVVWNVYKLTDATRGAVGFYAMPNVYGASALVGPAASLVELRRDVFSYVEKSVLGGGGGSSFGLGGEAAGSTAMPSGVYEAPTSAAASTSASAPEAAGEEPMLSAPATKAVVVFGAVAVLGLLLSRR